MGIGTDPCGLGPCGLDVKPRSVPVKNTVPAALLFDGNTRNFVLDASGQYRGVHPIDARVFMLLRTAKGSILSAPNVGQGVFALEYIDAITVDSFVRDQVRLSLQELTGAGMVSIDRVVVDAAQAARGRIFFSVDYTNLVTRKSNTFQ